MAQKDLRTYRRRSVTRNSGYHTCEETTGGECFIVHADRYICDMDSITFRFSRPVLELIELFERGISIVAFGGYIFSEEKATVSFDISYNYEGTKYVYNEKCEKVIESGNWLNIGFHAEQIINRELQITDATVDMKITSKKGNTLDFVSFDFDIVFKNEFLDASCLKSFYQKTSMHVPYLYYLRSDLSINEYLVSDQKFIKGRRVVLKSCNRCGRYLPINIDDELRTLSFSLHCKKKAPCVHSTFRAYEIRNKDRLTSEDLSGLKIEENRVISYYGHQLECKACKKFFVNAPLNPQRNAQQFKEDGLRRRAIEVLVNILLDKNLVHFEYERKTKKEFSKYIWEKFDKRCFKCGPDSEPIELENMALDHTMPLAYLYRLDESATCLCSSHNSQKRDHFPVDYYSEDELVRLSEITGLSLKELHKKEINQKVLDLLIENVEWFYDEFLMKPDYQKVRDGILTADKINDSLKRVIAGKVDLVEEYKKNKGRYPKSISLKENNSHRQDIKNTECSKVAESFGYTEIK